MTKVLILGANGQLARNTTRIFLETTDAELSLYLRRANRLSNPAPDRVTVVEGDVLDEARLTDSMVGHDVVYANLNGDMARQAKVILTAMRSTGVKRLIFISSMGIYNEVPGEAYRSVLDPYRDSAAIIEASDVNWTVLRPGWFTRRPSENYQLTRKGEPFIGHNIALDGLSALIVQLALRPELYVHESLGVSDN